MCQEFRRGCEGVEVGQLGDDGNGGFGSRVRRLAIRQEQGLDEQADTVRGMPGTYLWPTTHTYKGGGKDRQERMLTRSFLEIIP